jgi:hypothetical protein
MYIAANGNEGLKYLGWEHSCVCVTVEVVYSLHFRVYLVAVFCQRDLERKGPGGYLKHHRMGIYSVHSEH